MISLMRAGTAASAVSVAGLALGAGLLTAVPAAYAAGPVPAQPASAQDITWAQSNAQTDLAEIALGKLAEQRALRSATRTTARTIISDHEKALAQLKTVASETGITLPTAPSAAQQAQAARLMTIPSGQFDAMLDSVLIQGHELSISQTRTEIASGSSTTVKNFASVYLPSAEHHLMLTEADYAALTGAPTVSAGTGGMAATRPADDAPWLAAGAAGALLLAGTSVFGMRRRRAAR